MSSSGGYSGASPGAAPGGSPIQVDLDRHGRVVTVNVLRLTEDLRTSTGLDEAFQKALARRRSDELPAAPPVVDASGRIQVARTTVPARRPLRELVREAMLHDTSVPTARSTTLIGGERGVSENDCLTVVLDPAGQGGDLEADPGWLRQAAASKVGAAITQAFDAAYRERDQT